MPRYFKSHVIGRPLQCGGRSFIFEPVEPMGGSWLGVLAVDDESAANTLAACDGAWEITLEQFDALKKKRAAAGTAQGFVRSQTPQLPRQPLAADASPAGRRIDSASEDGGRKADDGPGNQPVASVELRTTRQAPPHEPLLEKGEAKRRKAA